MLILPCLLIFTLKLNDHTVSYIVSFSCTFFNPVMYENCRLFELLIGVYCSFLDYFMMVTFIGGECQSVWTEQPTLVGILKILVNLVRLFRTLDHRGPCTL